MVFWKNQLDLKDLWKWFENLGEEAKEDEERINEMGRKVSERIRSASFFSLYKTLETFALMFEKVTKIEEFNEVLDSLYNWADERHRCWIATF